MADRFITGDTVTLTNTFKVAGTATDPTTTTLITTEPGGSTTTYTNGSLTNSATGVYTKDIAANTNGIWSYKWTGTGTAADVTIGSFTVWEAPDSTDVLTIDEAKQALGIPSTTTTLDDYIATLVSAVSAQLDEMCGPIRTRTVTSETHDGGRGWIALRKVPVYSITTVTEYDGTTATTLTAETNAAKTAYNYIHDGTTKRLSSGRLVRRANNGDTLFTSGRRNIEVTYVAGRAANTDNVPAKFKQAASLMIRNIFVSEQASGTETFGAFTDQAPNPLLGPGLLNKVVALLQAEMIDGVAVL